MILLIPRSIILLLTFPGVILREISYRFFCYINDIPVYQVNYLNSQDEDFDEFDKVVLAKIPSIYSSLFFYIGPFIISSIMCMLLTFPIGIKLLLGTPYFYLDSMLYNFLQDFIIWVGFSTGLNAIPNNQEMQILMNREQSLLSNWVISIFWLIFGFFNIPYIGFYFKIAYVYVISMILPKIIVSFW